MSVRSYWSCSFVEAESSNLCTSPLLHALYSCGSKMAIMNINEELPGNSNNRFQFTLRENESKGSHTISTPNPKTPFSDGHARQYAYGANRFQPCATVVIARVVNMVTLRRNYLDLSWGIDFSTRKKVAPLWFIRFATIFKLCIAAEINSSKALIFER